MDQSIGHPARGTGKLIARAKRSDTSGADPCIVKPSASHRRTENQLYRVEIHDSGSADKSENNSQNRKATFKWSRENSSVVFPIRMLETSSGSSPTITITLTHLGQDNRFTLEQGDWVEIIDDDYILQNLAKPLLQVDSIDLLELKVTLSGTVDNRLGQEPKKHPYLRRWDRNKSTSEVANDKDGTQFVEEGKWLPLEAGVEILFPKPDESNSTPHFYRTGDYWLIPARTATGDVEWPGPINNPTSLPPHGIVHHYAPLAVLSVAADGTSDSFDCRRQLKQLWQ